MTIAKQGRPGAGATFYKGHGLGNDYLVFEEGDAWTLTAAAVAEVCHRWRGVGGDGVVWLAKGRTDGLFRLRMFNPDGSEFERSGNGLRILASHLARAGRVGGAPFEVTVGGDRLAMTVHQAGPDGYDVSVEMGRAQVGPEAVELDPAVLDAEGGLRGPDGEALLLVPVSVGNPHLVVFAPGCGQAELSRWGPFLSSHPGLSRGANVQLVPAADREGCRILIWERGVGRTAASGTSACAAAVASVHLGRTPPGPVRVTMEGGDLSVTVSPQRDVVLRGPVAEVCEGRLARSFVAALKRAG